MAKKVNKEELMEELDKMENIAKEHGFKDNKMIITEPVLICEKLLFKNSNQTKIEMKICFCKKEK